MTESRMKHAALYGRLVVLVVILAMAGPAAIFGSQKPRPAPRWQPTGESEVFTGDQLYFHIDGGAELYLEMGFEKLEVEYYQASGCDLSVESYHMAQPASALGVYLLRCEGIETPVDGVGDRNTGDYSEITAVRGQWIVQCINQTLDYSCLPMMIDLVNDHMSALPGEEDRSVLDELPPDGRIAGTERVIHGRHSLRLVAPDWPEDLLGPDRDALMVTAEYKIGSDTARLVEIICATPQAAGERFSALLEVAEGGWAAEVLDGASATLTLPDGQVIHAAIDDYRLVLAKSVEMLHHGLEQ